MEEDMKKHTEKERLEHIENWKRSSLSKTAYAKSAGIIPTTFYTWTGGMTPHEGQGFVEINKNGLTASARDIVIEKGCITIRVPLAAEQEYLQKILGVLGNIQ